VGRFVVTFQARDDLRQIGDYIARHDPHAAVRMLERLRDAFRHLGDNPRMGRERSDLGSRPVRCWPVGDYLVIHEGAGPVTILRVVSGYRDLGELLGG